MLQAFDRRARLGGVGAVGLHAEVALVVGERGAGRAELLVQLGALEQLGAQVR